MTDVTFRPIDTWPEPHEPVAWRCRTSQFRAGWGSTLSALRTELEAIDARHVVVQLALDETEIRNDGWPRANARPRHPGVILAVESKHGPLKYVTARFDRWEDNLRAIALGLKALRAVDRYGITKRGEQYTGWRALPAGADAALVERGRVLIGEHGGYASEREVIEREVIGDPRCPILHRWTFLNLGRLKAMVHHFLPESRDRDVHDHPRPFVTVVLRGSYVDEGPAGRDVLRAPAIRFRRAEHAHATYAGKRGAWTLVVMGPLRREWGFWRGGRWWPWREYEQRFGHAMRCEPRPRRVR